MAAIANEIDRILQAAPSRYSNAPNAAIILTASSPVFHIANGGAHDPASITFTASLIGLVGPVAFVATGGTVTVVGNVATLTYENMPGANSTVKATLTENGQAYESNVANVTKISDGASGTTSYTWIKYGTSAAGANLSDSPDGKTYIGLAHNKTTATESTNAADYTWSLIRGSDGQHGSDGTDGIPGAPGADGQTTYTWLKYSDNPDGTALYDVPTANTLYIGIAVNKTTAAESTVKTDYVWSKFRGDQGVPGTNGTNGPRGAGHFYAVGNPWTDALANAATPGENVVDDVVTVSSADGTYALEKKWNGSAWLAQGQVIDGALLVTGSVNAPKINANGLTIRTPAGAVILDAGGGGLQAGYEAPGTKNSDLQPSVNLARGSNLFTGSLGTPFGSNLGASVAGGSTDPYGTINGVTVTIPAAGAYVYWRLTGLTPGFYTIKLKVYITNAHAPVISSTDGLTWSKSPWARPTTTSTPPVWVQVSLRQHTDTGTLDVLFGSYHGATPQYTTPSSTTITISDLDVTREAYTGDLNATVGAPEGTYVGNSLAQLVENWAYNGLVANNAINDATTGLNARLRKNADDILGGVLSINAVTAPAGFRAGNLTWNSAGARTGGYGVAMTPQGLIGYNSAGTLTFFVNATNGDAYFGGVLGAATGSFGAVTIAAGGSLSSGQTAYNVGNGFWIQGGTTPKISMKTDNGAAFLCDPANNIMQMNNATLNNPILSAITGGSPGNISVTTSTKAINMGTRTAVGGGGQAPYTYLWSINGPDAIYITAGTEADASITVYGDISDTLATGVYTAYLSCLVTDGGGRSTRVSFTATVNFT